MFINKNLKRRSRRKKLAKRKRSKMYRKHTFYTMNNLVIYQTDCVLSVEKNQCFLLNLNEMLNI